MIISSYHNDSIGEHGLGRIFLAKPNLSLGPTITISSISHPFRFLTLQNSDPTWKEVDLKMSRQSKRMRRDICSIYLKTSFRIASKNGNVAGEPVASEGVNSIEIECRINICCRFVFIAPFQIFWSSHRIRCFLTRKHSSFVERASSNTLDWNFKNISVKIFFRQNNFLSATNCCRPFQNRCGYKFPAYRLVMIFSAVPS